MVYELHCQSMVKLLAYLDEHLFDGGEMEIYSCRFGHEQKAGNKGFDVEIDLNAHTFTWNAGKVLLDKGNFYREVSERLSMMEGRYVLVKKSWVEGGNRRELL